ncbi:heavy-metal-associated domain-containing protein [Parapusillimonas sp. SGNA-6]|nr:heavy-metal-associated domain-containing protein [Parapusillimonas sp. SGNA-6]
MMFEFTVQDMTCGHCVATITKAFKQKLPDAILEIDLPAHKVSVRGVAEAAAAASVLEAAGYSAQQTA